MEQVYVYRNHRRRPGECSCSKFLWLVETYLNGQVIPTNAILFLELYKSGLNTHFDLYQSVSYATPSPSL